MRVLFVTSLLLAMSMAGCTSGSSLQTYLMQSHEVPAGCGLLPYNGEEAADYREDYNWSGNPGRVDNEVFGGGEGAPVDNLVGVYDCDGMELASIALQFTSNDAASAFFGGATGFCDEGDAGLVHGNLVIFTDADDSIPDVDASLHNWTARVATQVGAADPCA